MKATLLNLDSLRSVQMNAHYVQLHPRMKQLPILSGWEYQHAIVNGLWAAYQPQPVVPNEVLCADYLNLDDANLGWQWQYPTAYAVTPAWVYLPDAAPSYDNCPVVDDYLHLSNTNPRGNVDTHIPLDVFRLK